MPRRPRRRAWRGLARAASGVTAVEFALISPVLLLTLVGLFDLGFNIYAQTMLDGAVQQAARAATLEGAAGNIATLDAAVTDAVHQVIPDATMSFSRKAYATFSAINAPEDFTDTNGNGVCDNGEAYEDANNNGQWDQVQGAQGNGGARDAVLYTVNMTYPRVFPLASFIQAPTTVTLRAATVLRNQPYGAGQSATPTLRYCP